MNDTKGLVNTPRQSAFTLIDTLLLASALTIATALLLPYWESYTVRSRVGECLARADVLKHAITDYREAHAQWPPRDYVELLTGIGTSRYCNGLTDYDPADGSFALDVNERSIDPKLGELQPRLTPRPADGGKADWQCSRGHTHPAQLRYLPALCRKLIG